MIRRSHTTQVEKRRKFETNKQKNIKISHNSQSFKIFPKISSFFPKQRFGLFAVSNSEHKSLVKKGSKSLFAISNNE